jgi:glycosyltransferase involved in cell wall biosynthesis
MKLSLILATVDRTSELARFLAALDRQRHQDFELIVVDQNPDDRLCPIIERHADRFPLQHIRSARGISRARNVGLRKVTGHVIGFPDDDCWYPGGLLEDLNAIFDSQPELGLLCGQVVNNDGIPWRTMPARNSSLTRYNLFRRATSIAMFIRREIADRVGLFDEAFGLGTNTPWTSGEEQDYLIRALRIGTRGDYLTNIEVHHEEPPPPGDQATNARTYSAARSLIRLLRKHDYPRWYIPYLVSLSAAGTMASLMRGNRPRMRHHWFSLEGRIAGWRDRDQYVGENIDPS